LYFEHGLFEIENLQYVDGYLEFEGEDWDFCNMYLMDVENEGPFNGYKYNLEDFIAKGSEPLEIIDDKYKAKEVTGVIDPSLIQTNNNKNVDLTNANFDNPSLKIAINYKKEIITKDIKIELHPKI
jgi:hypothetical protein